jgi:hypothetical protein
MFCELREFRVSESDRNKTPSIALNGNGRRVTTIRATRRMPFPDSNGRSEAGYGQSRMPRRSGKRRWRVRCSIGCGNGVVLSRIRSARSGVHGGNAASTRFMQQSPLPLNQVECEKSSVHARRRFSPIRTPKADRWPSRQPARSKTAAIRHAPFWNAVSRSSRRRKTVSVPL